MNELKVAIDNAQPFNNRSPPEFADEALALNFSKRHAEDLKYVASWGKWLLWDGTRWVIEETLKAYDMARAICRESAGDCGDTRIAKSIASAKTVSAVERLAKADRRHAALADQWDVDPWILNTPAGVVDLRAGNVRGHSRSDFCTKMTTAALDDGCPLWMQFLDRVTDRNGELQGFLQRLAGYSLTGVTTEHALFFLYGTGANGKSVYINTLSGLLGDYHKTAPMETFIATRNERHPTDLAGLRGARSVTATETEEGRRWAESKIKALTGGDKIAARFMRQDYFEFQPQFKLLIAGNHKPRLGNVDEAIRRRLYLVPFTVTIPEAERDEDLGEKLKSEWPGILQWAIDGCLEWQDVGLSPPNVVRDATDAYLEAEDALMLWIAECCVTGSNSRTTNAELVESWRNWAEMAGEYVGSQTSFTQRLEAKAFQRYRDKSARGFRGISVEFSDISPDDWNR